MKQLRQIQLLFGCFFSHDQNIEKVSCNLIDFGTGLLNSNYLKNTQQARNVTRRNTDLVLHCNRVPGHVDTLDGSKWGKGLPDGVLPKLVVNGTNVHPAHDGECALPLGCHLQEGNPILVFMEPQRDVNSI